MNSGTHQPTNWSISGGLTGVVLAGIYSLAFLAGRYVFIDQAESVPLNIFFPIGFICIIAGGIGTFTGLFISNIIETWRRKITKPIAVLLGGLFCLIVTLPIQLFGLVLIHPTDDLFWSFMISYTIPSIIYLFAGGWLAGRIYVEIERNDIPKVNLPDYIEF